MAAPQVKTRGFTIVELLIVIVVIGILAAIVIVAYQGVTNRANDSAIKATLKVCQTNFKYFTPIMMNTLRPPHS